MNPSEHKADSVGGSPVSLGDVSLPSDVETILSLGNNKRDSTISTGSSDEEPAPAAPVVPIPSSDDVTLPIHPEFAFEDGNVELQTIDNRFWVHEFLLKKFSLFGEKIEEARGKGIKSASGRLKIKASRRTDNIVAAFRVLYAPVFPGPEVHKFNSDTLIKALRIATVYGCSDMRKYAIAELERRFHFLPIDRVQMSDEFNLPSWEKPALVELCCRPDPISKEEAKILGLDRLTEISRIREAEQRRKFMELVDKSTQSHGLFDPKGPVPDDKLRADAKYTLKYSSLPGCDCKIQHTRDDAQPDERVAGSKALVPSGKRPMSMFSHAIQVVEGSRLSVVPCQLHQLAPRIASESNTLFKQRNELVRRLEGLKVAVSRQIPQGDKKDLSVVDEINQATWVRQAA